MNWYNDHRLKFSRHDDPFNPNRGLKHMLGAFGTTFLLGFLHWISTPDIATLEKKYEENPQAVKQQLVQYEELQNRQADPNQLGMQ